jgi:2-iminobutanoate/2-iminopropanoate deaminase
MPHPSSRRLAAMACAMAVLAPGVAMAAPRYVAPAQSNLPFSPAVQVGDLIFLSGQTGRDAQGHLPEGMEAQARNALANVAATAAQAGAGMDDIAKCTVMLADMSQWSAFNAIYVRAFRPGHLPARSAFGVSALAGGALVEVECIAAAPAGGKGR